MALPNDVKKFDDLPLGLEGLGATRTLRDGRTEAALCALLSGRLGTIELLTGGDRDKEQAFFDLALSLAARAVQVHTQVVRADVGM